MTLKYNWAKCSRTRNVRVECNIIVLTAVGPAADYCYLFRFTHKNIIWYLLYTFRRPTSTLNQKPIANGDIPQREDTEYPGSGFGSLPNKRLLFPSGELILTPLINPIIDVYMLSA